MSETRTRTAYDLLGGETALRNIVDRFYDFMDELPEVQNIRLMHPKDLTQPREKLFMFLSGWLGGPDLYQQKHGHPRLRARHLPFQIGERERDQWMHCMRLALDKQDMHPRLKEELLKSLFQTADHMRNIHKQGGGYL